MSFKYRLILFYIIIEAFFITLIVSVNFSALNQASKHLTEQRIESNISLIKELIKVPLSIYDFATLDNIVDKTVNRNLINTIIVYDNEDIILSSKSVSKDFFSKDIDFFDEKQLKVNQESEFYTKHIHVKENGNELGSFIIIFDLKSSNEFITENRNKTLVLIIFEILISLFVSYYTGNKLTRMLEILSIKAKEIGEGKDPQMPYLNKKDEIGVLANSMKKMKIHLDERRNNIFKMQKQKDNFFANMSHELKTPLNSINIISTVMLKNKNKNLNEQELKNIKIINNCGKDLLVLINDILDISKIEDGQIIINPKEFNFNDLYEEIVDMFKVSAKEKNIEFIYEKDESLKIVNNDEVRIKQILINLIGNAMKFTSKGKVSLKITDLGENIRLIIKDEGIGIPKDKQKLIFKRFKQVDEGIARKYGGTGLGLAICDNLVKLLDGKIEVNSKLGEGSVFTVVIKKNIDKSLKTDINKNGDEIESLHLETHEIENEKQNILVLNDDVISFMPYSVELKRKAESLVQVDDIDQFIKQLLSNKFDILILNIENFSQFIIYDSLRGVEFNKLFLISNKDTKVDEKLENLAEEVFIKPIDKNHFIDKIIK